MPPRRSRAFTTIELLVAISIIIVLAGILLIGMSVLRGTQGSAATEVDLKNLQAMLTEFDATSRMGERTKPGTWYGGNPSSGDFWFKLDATPAPITAPGNVRDGQPDRTQHDAVLNTVVAMMRLQGVPAVRQMIESLASDRQMRIPSAGEAAIPLDAWGNPIIFVPGSGLDVHMLTVTGATEYPATLTPNWIIISREGQVSGNGTGGRTVETPGRPFWASAGPDGNFMTGDDNLYSFER